MIKRTLFFSSAVDLSLHNRQLIIKFRDNTDDKSIPIEDIGVIVIENQQSHISMPAINALSDNNVAVVFCGANMMPNAMLLNLESNTTQGERYRAQIEASLPLKKALWQQIIVAKIRNQSHLLDKLGFDGNKLKPFYQNVKSGDGDNREGIAARIYWTELFGKGFLRTREGEVPNNLLNYGYSILRAAVARAIMGAGLFPAFGIFHRNRANAFPLADDIMEPFRPYVDEVVYQLFISGDVLLDKSTKGKLIQVLYTDTIYDKVTRPLEIGLTMTCASLSRCFENKQKRLSLPSF